MDFLSLWFIAYKNWMFLERAEFLTVRENWAFLGRISLRRDRRRIEDNEGDLIPLAMILGLPIAEGEMISVAEKDGGETEDE